MSEVIMPQLIGFAGKGMYEEGSVCGREDGEGGEVEGDWGDDDSGVHSEAPGGRVVESIHSGRVINLAQRGFWM